MASEDQELDSINIDPLSTNTSVPFGGSVDDKNRLLDGNEITENFYEEKDGIDNESFVQIEKKECRICLDESYDTTDNPFISPCFCSGTSKFVHRKCLNTWRATRQNPRAFTNCSECGFEYQLQLIRREEKKGKLLGRKGKFRYLVARDTLLAFAIIQFAVIVLGLFVRSLDSQEKIVDFFGFREFDDEVPSWSNTYQHHKTTYYISGLLLGFFLLGIGFSIYRCCCATDDLGHGQGGGCCGGCYAGDCRGCWFIDFGHHRRAHWGSGVNCGGKAGKECLMILLAALIIFVIVMIFVGIIVGIFMVTLFIQRVVQRHYHVLQKKVLAKEYQVVDLDSLEGSDVQVIVDKPRPEPSAPPQEIEASAPDESLMVSWYSNEGEPKFKTEQQRQHYHAVRQLEGDLGSLSIF